MSISSHGRDLLDGTFHILGLFSLLRLVIQQDLSIRCTTILVLFIALIFDTDFAEGTSIAQCLLLAVIRFDHFINALFFGNFRYIA